MKIEQKPLKRGWKEGIQKKSRHRKKYIVVKRLLKQDTIPTDVHGRNYSRQVTNDVLTFVWDDIVVARNLIGRCIPNIL